MMEAKLKFQNVFTKRNLHIVLICIVIIVYIKTAFKKFSYNNAFIILQEEGNIDYISTNDASAIQVIYYRDKDNRVSFRESSAFNVILKDGTHEIVYEGRTFKP